MATNVKHNAIQDARALKALELRLAGASYRQIAVSVGASLKTVYLDVQRMLREYASEPAEQVRNAELGRLDRLLLAHWPAAVKGDYRATATVLSIMDRRARLLGLDAPLRIDLTAWVRRLAEEEGLDPEQAVQDAEAIVRAAGL